MNYDRVEEVTKAFKLIAGGKEIITYQDLVACKRSLDAAEILDGECRAMVEEFNMTDKGGVDLDEFLTICLR